MENLLILVAIAVISGISGWLQKKRQTPPTDEPTKGSSAPSRPTATDPGEMDLEKVLRRLLGGEPLEPPPRPVAPPPLAEIEPPQPPLLAPAHEVRPQPIMRQSRPLATAPTPAKPAMERRMSLAKPDVAKTVTTVTPTTRPPEPPVRATRPSRKFVLPPRVSRLRETDKAIAQLLQAQTARQAFVASLVFGPPKSLENPPL